MNGEDTKATAPGRPAGQTEAVDWTAFFGSFPDTALEQAGLFGASHNSECITLHELTGTAIFRLRSRKPFTTLDGEMSACDLPLPDRVNQSMGRDPVALCLAPGEWLVFSEYLGADRLREQMEQAVDPHDTALLDLSAGLTAIRLSGTASRWLLAKLCGLDFGRDFKTPHRSARTRLQQAGAIIHFHWPGGLSSEPVFDLIFDRSLARYVWQLMVACIPHAEELRRQFPEGP